MKRFFTALPAVAALFVADTVSCAPVLPPSNADAQMFLDQQWTPEQRNWFHHASQGTVTFGIPYEWFIALQAPGLDFRNPFSSNAYLTRFGFLASPASLPDNPDGLPIGFARGAPQVDPRTGQALNNPVTGKPMTEFGLTCAACHTGQLVYKGTAITIDGGSAMLDLGKLREALGLAIIETNLSPRRFAAFASRVLGPGAPTSAQSMLRQQFKVAVDGVKQQ